MRTGHRERPRPDPKRMYSPSGGRFRYNDETFDRVIRDYNLNDLAI